MIFGCVLGFLLGLHENFRLCILRVKWNQKLNANSLCILHCKLEGDLGNAKECVNLALVCLSFLLSKVFVVLVHEE